MVVEEELKRDHAEMQAVIEAKQKIIDAQVPHTQTHSHTDLSRVATFSHPLISDFRSVTDMK